MGRAAKLVRRAIAAAEHRGSMETRGVALLLLVLSSAGAFETRSVGPGDRGLGGDGPGPSPSHPRVDPGIGNFGAL